MKYLRLVLCIGLCTVFGRATSANAQIVSRLSLTSPDTTILALTHRIETLESTIAQLQQKLAFIKSVNPLVFDAGSGVDVRIRAENIVFESGSALTLKAGTNMSVQGANQVLVQAFGVLDLKGSTVRHNGGSVPVACAAGSPVVACSGTVGVPPPGQ